MKGIFFLIIMLHSTLLVGQYWQQKVDYKMNIEFDDSLHQYTGKQELTYYNNSPDTIRHLFYHLYNNAFQPGSMMDIRSQSILDPEKGMSKIKNLKANEVGYLRISSLSQASSNLQFEEHGTILKVKLNNELLPGKRTTINMIFTGQSPTYTRRSGRYNKEGVAYSMAQWYPKLCEYDLSGWNATPYIGKEFYGVWGDFDVKITISTDFVLGGSGVVMNAKEVKNGYGGFQGKPEGEKVTWHFRAKNVHDFVWAADKEYVHKIVKVNEQTDVHLLYKDDTTYAKNWELLASTLPRLFRFVNDKYGKYEYPSFSVIQGGDRGMEYPMATLLNGNRSYGSLLGTTVHELMHQWYYMALGTDETSHPWMDEGFANYTDAVVMNYILRDDSISIPDYNYARKRVIALGKTDKNEALTTPADHYASDLVYGISAYNKGAMYLNQLSYIIGHDKVDQSLRRYFNEWKSKHPRPEDFMLVAEKVSGIELDWYNDYYINSLKQLDYGIKSVVGSKSEIEVVLERNEAFIMPVDIEVVLKNGEFYYYTIPLQIMYGHKDNPGYENFVVLNPWPWVQDSYTFVLPIDVNEVLYMLIDPLTKTIDNNLENNMLILDVEEATELFIEN